MAPRLKAWSDILDGLHKEIYAVVEPLTDAQINWAHPHLANTVGILLRHIAGSERYWIGEVAGGHPAHRNRAAEFVREPLKKAPLIDGLRDAQTQSRRVIDALTDADLADEVEVSMGGRSGSVTKGWALLHALEHTSYHLGQLKLFHKMATAGKDP